MFWTAIFIIAIAQGIFLISLLMLKRSSNRLASLFLIMMVIIMMLTCFGYLVSRTELADHIPYFFAVPFGMMLLYGPLLYFYARAVLNIGFRWKPVYWLHLLPYLLQLSINWPMFQASQESWNWFNHQFLTGQLPILPREKVTFALHNIQLFIYLLATYRLLQNAKKVSAEERYLISLPNRLAWVKQLAACFLVFLVTVSAIFVFLLTQGNYQPVTNYFYTIIISAIIYFMAYKVVLSPALISPGFEKKYKSYMPFSGSDGEKFMIKLELLMARDKIFTNAGLKLAILSREVGLPAHQVSKLINEKFGKSFSDFVNEYRVEEFIRRIKDRKYSSHTVYGIALDVGFNSKSSFNTAFKKITGKNPSEFKTGDS